MIRWTGLAPWEFEIPFPGSLTSTFLLTPEIGDDTFLTNSDGLGAIPRACEDNCFFFFVALNPRIDNIFLFFFITFKTRIE